LKDVVQKVNTLTAGLAAINKTNDREKEILDGLKPQQDMKKYFFNVFLNQVNNSMEFSATMASSLILGLSSVKVSHEFWLVYISSAIELVLVNYNKRLLIEKEKKEKENNEINMDISNSPISSNLNIDTSDILYDKKKIRNYKLSSLRYRDNSILNTTIDEMDENIDDYIIDINIEKQKVSSSPPLTIEINDEEQKISTSPPLSGDQLNKSMFSFLKNKENLNEKKNDIENLNDQVKSPSSIPRGKDSFTKFRNKYLKTPDFIKNLKFKTPSFKSIFKSPNATTKKDEDNINNNNEDSDEVQLDDIINYQDNNDSDSVEDNLGENRSRSNSSNNELENNDMNNNNPVEEDEFNMDANNLFDNIPDELNSNNKEDNLKTKDVNKDSPLDDDVENFFEGILENVEHVSNRDKSNNSKQSASINYVTDKNGKIKATLSNQATNYSYRGNHLSNICLYLYVGIIVIVPIGDLEYIDPNTNVSNKPFNEMDYLINDDDDSDDNETVNNDNNNNDNNNEGEDDNDINNSDNELEEEEEEEPEGIDLEDEIQIERNQEDQSEDNNEKSDKKDKKGGRFKNKYFFFSSDCPYHESYVQVIRSKFRIPLIPCYKPKYPKFTEKPSNSKLSNEDYYKDKLIEADKYGIFMLTLFKPWNIETKCPNGDLDWFGFCDFISLLCKRYDIVDNIFSQPTDNSEFGNDSNENQMDNKNKSNKKIFPTFTEDSEYYRIHGDDSKENQEFMENIIKSNKKRIPYNRFIYQIIENMTTGLNPKKNSKKMLMIWRNRMVIPWAELKLIKSKNNFDRKNILAFNQLDYVADQFDLEEMNHDLEDAGFYNIFEKMINQMFEKQKNLSILNDKDSKLDKDIETDLKNQQYLSKNVEIFNNILNLNSNNNNNNNNNINIDILNPEQNYSIPLKTNFTVLNIQSSNFNNSINNINEEMMITNYKNKSIQHNVKISFASISSNEILNEKYSSDNKNEIIKWYEMLDKIEKNEIKNINELSLERPSCLGSLNEKQNAILNLFINNWKIRLLENKNISKKRKNFKNNDNNNNNQILNFVHGGPGTGKTFLILRCLETLEIMNYQKFLKLNNLSEKTDAAKVYATTGIAATLYIVYNSSTLFSGLSIPIAIYQNRKGRKDQQDDVGKFINIL
jgi:hypothetical protein